MPSTSEAQKNFFSLVNAYKKGGLKKSEVSKSVVDTAKYMTKKEIEDYLKLDKSARNMHYGIPAEDEAITLEDIMEFLDVIEALAPKDTTNSMHYMRTKHDMRSMHDKRGTGRKYIRL